MKKKQLFLTLAVSAAFLLLIFDGKTALLGAAEGIELCLKTLIPSLFPFFVLSILLTSFLTGQSVPFLRSAARLCNISECAESLLAIGLLGGYPVGAQNIAIAYRSGQLSRGTAERMLSFCNNAGPAFIFGILAPMFSNIILCWALWGIHIVSALMVGMVLPGSPASAPVRQNPSPVTLTQALEKAIRTMALVCGWVILFRMLLTFLESWILWLFPASVQIVISGLLELSNGCVQLALIENEGLRFLIAGGLLSFGGCCVTLQTASVCVGLSLHFYFPGKLLQCCISLLLISGFQLLLYGLRPPIPPVILLIIVIFSVILIAILRKGEKTSRNPTAVGV